jgi:hypothetical protein
VIKEKAEEKNMESRKLKKSNSVSAMATRLSMVAAFLLLTGCEFFHNPFLPDSPARSDSGLLSNGDFEDGNTGFYSDFRYGGPGSRSYHITTNPNAVYGSWPSISDHTSRRGNMLLVDGGLGVAWRETVAVQHDTIYTFRGYTVNCHLQEQAQISIRVNGVEVLAFNVSPYPEWNEFTVTWASYASNSAIIDIYDTTNAGTGNDFAIDDLSFH